MQRDNTASDKKKNRGLGWLRTLALLPLPLFIVLIIFFAYSNPSTIFEPPYLLPALNILFLTIVPFAVAYLVWRSYADGGQMSLFFIGCGMVAFGFGSLVAGFTIDLPAGTNLTPAIHNTGALIGAILLCTAAIFSQQRSPQYKLEQHRALYLGLCYLAIIIFISIFAIAVYERVVPPFFAQGTGPTLLRQFVLGTATLLFAISSVIFVRVYFRSHSDFTYWFSIALILITIGLCAIFLQKSVGGPIGWTGRTSQYVGCIYLLVGIMAVYRIADIKKVPLENEFARSFNYIEANYKTLFEMAPNAIISVDNKGTILTWNPAAVKIFGHTDREAIGTNAIDFIFPRESALLLNNELQKLVRAKGKAKGSSSKIETIASRKQGGDFPVEVSMGMRKISGIWLGTFIISDITERKQSEEAIRHLATFPQLTPVMIAEFNRQGEVLFSNPSMQSALKQWDVEHANLFIPLNWRMKLSESGRIYETTDVQEIILAGHFIENRIHFIKESQTLRIYATDITERKIAEEALRARETHLSLIHDNVYDVIFVIGVEPSDHFRFISVNQRFIEVTGLTEDQIVGKFVQEVIPEPAHALVLGKYKEAIRNRQPAHWEEVSLYPTGLKAGEVTVAPVFDANGNCTQLVGTVHDITERKRAEEQLKMSEEKFRNIFDNSAIGKSITSVDGIVNANQALADMLGYTKEELSHVKWQDVSHPDEIDETNRKLEPLQAGREKSARFIKRYMKKDGSIVWADVNTVLQRDGDGNPLYYITAVMDITDREQAEEAILRSKLLLQSVIDSTPDWMYVKDLQHKYLLVNKSFADSQNVIPQDIIGKADTDVFPEELCLGNPDKGIPGFHADDLQAFQGHLVHNPRNIISWPDGSLHIYDTYKIPLTDQSGQIYGALVYSRDMTEQRKAEDEREVAIRSLQKTMDSMISTMSRIVEMRDPYTAGHQQRVADLSGAIAREMNLDNSRIEHLVIAAKVHDIGKMYVPSDILSKPGKLSRIEFDLIKTHAQGSYNILQDLEFQQPVALMALQHHERLDGSGYPNQLKGKDILLEAKILAVADVVEAMSSHRPYRPAPGMDKALEEISRNKGTLYDTNIVDTCLKLFKERGFKFEEVKQ